MYPHIHIVEERWTVTVFIKGHFSNWFVTLEMTILTAQNWCGLVFCLEKNKKKQKRGHQKPAMIWHKKHADEFEFCGAQFCIFKLL